MKKIGTVCILVMCLAMPGFSSRIIVFPSEREAENIRKDAAIMRKYIEEYLLSWLNGDDIMKFKQRFGLTDDVMQIELMDIIHKSATKTRWQWVKANDSKDMEKSTRYLREAINWLSVCADAEGKMFLMSVITDNEKHSEFRRVAGWSYLRRADAQEIRDVLPRLFTDEIWIKIDPFGLYHGVTEVYDRMEGDTQTREAIVAAMSAALAKEANTNVFARADKLLAERSKEYAESPQRKAALERMNKPPETLNP